MMNKILMILAALGAMVLQGCSGAPISQPNLLQWEESRFARVRVLAEPLFVDTTIPGMNIRTFEIYETNQSLVSGYKRVPFPYPDSEWNLRFGDIIDVYYGADRWGDTYAEGQNADKAFLSLPENQRSQVLGVVCRAAEGDCERNSKHELAIGWGRKMRGPDDYRGVAAEAKQRIYQPEVDRGGVKRWLRAPIEAVGLGGGVKSYTPSYVKKGLSADYEDPPEERQEHYENPCGGVHAFIGCKDAPFFSLEDE